MAQIPTEDSQHRDPLSGLPGYALRRAANAMIAELAALLAPINLRISDASVLLLVQDRADMTASEIGKILDIHRTNMVPLLSRLKDMGLIMRHPIDRKSQAIVLTEAGQQRLALVLDITSRFEADLMARIPAIHRPHFLPALHALTAKDQA